jgi:hypothetical protein
MFAVPLRRSRTITRTACLLALLALLTPCAMAADRADKEFPTFKVQEIEKTLGVGYAVLLVDVNGDGKKDIVIVDQRRVLWYENPSWKRRVIIEGVTEPDNVCIAPYDIDGDGKVDFALGSGWNPANTKTSGTLQWLRRGSSLDEPWTVHPIAAEPTLHRIRFIDIDGRGRPALVVVPLMGRNSTAAKNHVDGLPVNILAFHIPPDPTRERWPADVLNGSLHVVHNFCPIPAPSRKGMDILTASYEGVHLLHLAGQRWTVHQLGQGNQDNPQSNRGASEVKMGVLKSTRSFIATIEPWHGHQVVVYTPPENVRQGPLWQRQVIDDKLKWGHAVWCADIDGDGDDELIVGVRDHLSNRTGERSGVRIYKATDPRGTRWQRNLIDEGGVQVEDLAAADLDGDGHIDLVAVGRGSHNARIYWNRGKP